jgi:multidrug efflux pump subunit AcrA (membrane-fusion protein)
MKTLPTLIGLSLLAVLCAGVWVLRYRPDWVAPAVQEEADDEDVDPQKLEIPVHAAAVKTATLHRFVNAIGIVEPAPARGGQMAGTADVASPVAGVISQILCEAGQQVKKGDPLIQLDDRLAIAAEQQAAAALAEARASQEKLKTTPRPEQEEMARLKVEHAKQALDFAQRNYDRQQELARNQGTSEKNVEQARLDLAAAQNELASAQKEQVLLKPAPQEIAEEDAKVAAAEAALAAAKAQREMLRITSPIDATVIAVSGNPGEFVDTSKVLIDLVSLDRLVVNVQIPVQESGSLKAGMPAQLSLASAGSDAQPVEGQIHFVGSEVDQKTNSIPVSIDLPPSAGAKPGESVHVHIVAEEHKDCLAVPKESVVADENGDNFIALLNGDQATHKTVRVGIREGDLVEVIADGLKAGDAIVGGGAYGLAKFQVAKVKVSEK